LFIYTNLLLKFLNSRTLQCYPRVQTIVTMTGLSKRSIFRCLTLLVKANIISKKRLKSTSLYTLNSSYVVSTRHLDVPVRHLDVPVRHHLVPVSHVLEEPITKHINITTVDEIMNKGLAKDIAINLLSKLPSEDLNNSIYKHPYYVKLAISKKEELLREKNLVPTEKILASLRNTTKKSNSRYIEKVEYNKRNNLDYKGNPK